MAAPPPAQLPRSWTPLDLGLHAFLVVNPLVLGLWLYSLSPLVGGNLFLAAALAGGVLLLGAIVFGTLGTRWPWTGGDYAWQTRLLAPPVGAVLAIAAWCFVVAALAPVYGNLILVEVVEPLLATTGQDGLAGWFRGRDGIFAGSLIAIALATAFVGLGMRRAALVQRVLIAVGGAAFLAVVVLLLTSDRDDFRSTFDERSADVYGTGSIVSSRIALAGPFEAEGLEVAPADTLRLVPLILLFALWIGWAGPLVGEVRSKTAHGVRLALFRAAAASVLASLVVLLAVGRGVGWELWNDANYLYWHTLYGGSAATPLPAWPNPVVFATWTAGSTAAEIVIVVCAAALVVGFVCTLFLAATRVLLAAAADTLLPRALVRTTGDSVPLAALACLVIPATALAAADAYWDSFASWSTAVVVALGLTTMGSAVAAAVALRRSSRSLAVASALFALLVAIVVGAWLADPLYRIRGMGPLAFLLIIYSGATGIYLVRGLIARGGGSGSVARSRDRDLAQAFADEV